MNRTSSLFVASCVMGGLAACAPDPAETARWAFTNLGAARIEAHTRFLADDVLEGRGTGSRGYDIAARYVAAQFESIGILPGAADGSYFQTIRFRRTFVEAGEMTIGRPGAQDLRLELGRDFISGGRTSEVATVLKAPLVFAGHGVRAPELSHDDYAGLDVEGKVVVILGTGPPGFGTNTAAHYSDTGVRGRMAARLGAVGMITIWTPAQEQLAPWSMIARLSRRGRLAWLDGSVAPSAELDDVGVGAMMNHTSGSYLFEGAPKSLDAVLESAEEGRVEGFDLDGEITIRLRYRHEDMSSPNIVGRIQGSDPTRRNEYVVYTAHVDHEGIGEPSNGDAIYNGAVDNAAGVAALIEVGRAFSELREPPRRSVLLIGTAAEEEGLLGAEFFVSQPTVPLAAVVANLNMDGNHMLIEAGDILAFGSEHSSLGAVAAEAAETVGLSVSPDPWPEQHYFIRSDHYPFVKRGIPSLFFIAGITSRDPGVDGLARLEEYRVDRYHKPSDDLSQELHWRAGAEYAAVVFLTGLAVANAPERPMWIEGDFFGEMFDAETP